jgi:Na+/H+-dicarboxylate symporter
VIAGTLAFFDIPEAGLLLILAIDHFLDMGRSATNVVGNAVAAAVIAKWEGDRLDPIEAPDIVTHPAPTGHGPATAVDSFDKV